MRWTFRYKLNPKITRMFYRPAPKVVDESIYGGWDMGRQPNETSYTVWSGTSSYPIMMSGTTLGFTNFR